MEKNISKGPRKSASFGKSASRPRAASFGATRSSGAAAPRTRSTGGAFGGVRGGTSGGSIGPKYNPKSAGAASAPRSASSFSRGASASRSSGSSYSARPSYGASSGPRTGAYSPRPSYGARSTSGFSPARSSAPQSGGSSSYSSRPSYGASSRGTSRGSYGSRGGYASSRGGFSSGRGGFSGSRGGFGGGRGRSGGGKSERLDFSKFVNKVTVVEEAEVFTPEHRFADFQVIETLKNAIVKKGYEFPTPIQDKAIPHVLNGADVVGIANTGTGKTAAFLIPLINKVLQDRKEQAMIIVPTRELAIQIEEELVSLTAGMKIFGVCCVGGAPIGRQISQLRYQYNFIIGTPGRIKDLIARKMIFLDEFNTIVLDEADRMLDMGFVADMRLIMAGMPKTRQTLFFSATLSSEIEKLIGEFLNKPVRISVKTRDTSKNVEQDVVRVPKGKDKIDVLHDLLNDPSLKKVLVFGRTKHGVEKLSTNLLARGFKAESIHGDKNHGKRQQALRLFKDGKVQVLVATDVAARGLDIADVSHVINYELPATHDDYVHRIGRTGRGGKKGKALTFLG